MEETLPPGFRFHPTDQELITYYLMRKVCDTNFTCKAVTDVDLNKNEPWDLPSKASAGGKEWYFFSLRDRKYPTGLRTNRATEAGYWKTTGKDREITMEGPVIVGMKKTLVFYKGRAPRGEKTNWVMHEYRLHNSHSIRPSKEEWVVCRVFQKSSSAAKKTQQTSSSQQSLDPPTPHDHDHTSFLHEFRDVTDLPNLNTITPDSSATRNNTTNMSWPPPPASDHCLPSLPSLSWPSGLLDPNLSVNSLLLKALQLRSCQQRENTMTDHFASSYMPPPQGVSQVMASTPNLTLEASSSSKASQDMPQQQQQEQEQPFNLDSFW